MAIGTHQGSTASMYECYPSSNIPLCFYSQQLNFIWFAVKTCPPGKGLILDEKENCVCPPGYAFDENGNCIPCPSDRGFIVDSEGRCVCDSSKGLVLDPSTKRCVCPPGKELNENGFCVDGKSFWNIVVNKGNVYFEVLMPWPCSRVAAWPRIGANKIIVNFDCGSIAAWPQSLFQKFYKIIPNFIEDWYVC